MRRFKYVKVKIDGLPIPKDRLVKGPYEPILVGTVSYLLYSISVTTSFLDLFSASDRVQFFRQSSFRIIARPCTQS